ncbi:MAG: hypothetical protein V4735_00640 [Pseudomonadota bacterium]
MNNDWSMKQEGVDGVVELRVDRLILTRPGIWSLIKFNGKGRREIPYGALSEVQFKDAKALIMGEIEFVRNGSNPKDERHFYRIKFKKNQQANFEKLKEKIFEILNYYASKK